MNRLRLSATRQPYRRGGWKIGPKHAPTLVEAGVMDPPALLAILRDPVVTVAQEIAEDVWETPSAAERGEAAEHLAAAIAADELRDSEAVAEMAEELLDGSEAGAALRAAEAAPENEPAPAKASGRKPAAKAKG